MSLMFVDTHSEQLWKIEVGIGAVLFTLVLVSIGTYFFKQQVKEDWKQFLLKNYALFFGAPMASVAAFGLVVFFGVTTAGPIEVNLWGLQLKGPAGPLLMWVITFLSFCLAIRMLKKE